MTPSLARSAAGRTELLHYYHLFLERLIIYSICDGYNYPSVPKNCHLIRPVRVYAVV